MAREPYVQGVSRNTVAHHFFDLVTVFTFVKRGREGRASTGVREEKVNKGGGCVLRGMSGGMDEGEGAVHGYVTNPTNAWGNNDNQREYMSTKSHCGV